MIIVCFGFTPLLITIYIFKIYNVYNVNNNIYLNNIFSRVHARIYLYCNVKITVNCIK